MRVFENREFRQDTFADRDSGAVFGDLEFRKCYFEGFFLSLTKAPALRSTVRNVRLINCSQRGCSVYCAVLEDVLVDGLDTNKQVLQTFGAVFNRVIVRGKVDRLMISNDVFPALDDAQRERETALFRMANAQYYQQVDWALDISGGEFRELDIRGVPVHLIRRDPATQAIVTRERVLEGRWKDLDFNENVWPVALSLFLQRNEPARIVIAPKRHARFRSYLEDLQLLRRAGVAEPD